MDVRSPVVAVRHKKRLQRRDINYSLKESQKLKQMPIGSKQQVP